LKFAYEETGASVKNDKDMEKLNQMDTDGVNFRHQKQKEKAKKFSYEEAKKKKEAKQHSKKAIIFHRSTSFLISKLQTLFLFWLFATTGLISPAVSSRRKKPKSFLMRKQKRRRKQSSIPRRHRSIRQMMEKLLERRNPA